MNREILFRGKRVDNGEWATGDLLRRSRRWGDPMYKILVDTSDIEECPEEVEVIPETVCQYTGIKDDNGIMIFEGDIIGFEGHEYRYIVSFEAGSFVCYHTNSEYGRWGNIGRIKDADFTKYKVILYGNISDNPQYP